MPEAPEMPTEDESELMDHVAMEAIHAVHARDHEGFRNAFHALVAHTLSSLSDTMEPEKE